MSPALRTVTTFRATINPFSRYSHACRIFLSILRTPATTPANSPTHIDIKVTRLPRNSTQPAEMTVGFRGGKELRLEVEKKGMKIGDVVEEVERVARAIQREESLNN